MGLYILTEHLFAGRIDKWLILFAKLKKFKSSTKQLEKHLIPNLKPFTAGSSYATEVGVATQGETQALPISCVIHSVITFWPQLME